MTAINELRNHLIAVMAKYPDLTVDGLNGDKRSNFEDRRAALLHPLHVDEFRMSLAWLEHVPKVKSSGKGSYFLKHVVEAWVQSYIANGAFIAAAVHAGFRVERDEYPTNPNPLIGVASGRHWPLRPDGRGQDSIRRRFPGNKKIVAPPLPIGSENKC